MDINYKYPLGLAEKYYCVRIICIENSSLKIYFFTNGHKKITT